MASYNQTAAINHQSKLTVLIFFASFENKKAHIAVSFFISTESLLTHDQFDKFHCYVQQSYQSSHRLLL